MVQTDYIAFGYKLCKVELDVGDRVRSNRSALGRDAGRKFVFDDWYMVENDYNPNLTREDYLSGNYTYNELSLIISGKLAITPIHTMIPTVYTRGYSNIDCPYEKGMVKDQILEPTVIFCIDPFANLDKVPVMPDVSILRWTAGSIIEPPLSFFLADGSFKKDSTAYSTTGAYSLSNNSIEITSDCLGFIFN